MSPAVDRVLAALREHGIEPRRSGSHWSCRCPAHDDRTPSLSISAGDDGRALLHDFAGCKVEAIVSAIGLTMRDLKPDDPSWSNGRGPRGDGRQSKGTFPTVEAAIAEAERRQGGPSAAKWEYTNAAGDLVGLAIRWDTPTGKDMRPVSKTPAGWIIGGMPAPRPLYHLRDLLAAPRGSRAWVCEGEKCVDAACGIGLLATTSAHGSQSPAESDWSPLRGHDVVILPDHDDAGEKYAQDVARLAMAAGARSVRVVRLPDLPPSGDIADYVAAMDSRTSEDISAGVEALAEAAEPVTPSAPAAATSESPIAPAFVTARQLCADHPHLPQPIIHGLLRRGETANLIAPSKRGKSWLVNMIALCVASGRRLFGRFDVERADVLILDNELHAPTIAHRLPLVAEAMRLSPDEWVDRVHVEPLRGRLVDLYTMEAHYFPKLAPGRFRLIIADAWYRFLPRESDENSNADLTALYNTLDRIAEQVGAAFLLVHHASKGSQAEKSITDTGSGAGAQSRAADAHLVLRDHEEENVVVLDAALRSWPPIEPVCLRWTFPIWTVAEGLDPSKLRKRQTRAAAEKPEKPKPMPWTLSRFVTEIMNPTAAGMDSIVLKATEAGVGVSEAKRLLNAGVEAGVIHEWRYQGSNKIRYATVPQPVCATADGVSLSRARAPRTPRGRQKSPRGQGRLADANDPRREPRRPATPPHPRTGG